MSIICSVPQKIFQIEGILSAYTSSKNAVNNFTLKCYITKYTMNKYNNEYVI